MKKARRDDCSSAKAMERNCYLRQRCGLALSFFLLFFFVFAKCCSPGVHNSFRFLLYETFDPHVVFIVLCLFILAAIFFFLPCGGFELLFLVFVFIMLALKEQH